MQIGNLAQQTGITRDTLRFYERLGLIRSVRASNSYRTYPPETVELLKYIRIAQTLGFTLAEISINLPGLWQAEAPDQALAAMLIEKVAVIDRKIEELRMLKEQLLARAGNACPLRGRIEVIPT